MIVSCGQSSRQWQDETGTGQGRAGAENRAGQNRDREQGRAERAGQDEVKKGKAKRSRAGQA